MDAAAASTDSCCTNTTTAVATLAALVGEGGNNSAPAAAAAFEQTLSDGDLLSIELWVYAGSTIAVLGVAGHVLAAAALLSSRELRSLPISVFLLAMFASGASALCVGLVRQIVHHRTHYEVDVRELAATEAGCDVHAMLTYASLQYYAWLQATAAVERLVSATRPLTYRRWFTPRRNAVLALGELMVLLALNGPVAAALGYDAFEMRCKVVDPGLYYNVWGYVDLCLYAIFPAAVLLPCDAAIVVRLHGRQRKMASTVRAVAVTSLSWTSSSSASRSSPLSSERLQGCRTLISQQSSAAPCPSSPPPLSPHRPLLTSSSSVPPLSPGANALPLPPLLPKRGLRRRGGHRARPVTIALLAINGVFLASTLPVSVLFLLPWPSVKGTPADDMYVLLWTVFNLIQYAGCSVSSIAYFALGSKFRESISGPVKRLLVGVRLPRRGGTELSPSRIAAQSNGAMGDSLGLDGCGSHQRAPWSKKELRRIAAPFLPTASLLHDRMHGAHD